ncbi:MAG TPA: EAL domain-containing protein [Solirubrobacteraceae bacterium]|nr:EAL domain-containing protein [Solirubrobacteraceae bacterium]
MPSTRGRTGERAERELAARKAQADLELQRLGEALKARSGDVVDDVVRRTQAAGADVDDVIRASLESVGNTATSAVALWMAGGKPDAGKGTANEVWGTFGNLAAHRAAPLDELTKRCLRWRDAVNGVLRDSAANMDISLEALTKAIAMTQMTVDATLVSMCAVFETERKRTDEELEHRQEELAFMATHDQLTGLPNRTLIVDRAEQMFARARRRQSPVAALFINLDNFTSITDTLGHAIGDELVQAIAARLDGVVRDSDALGRLGRDEFVVLAEEISLAAGPELIAERIQEALKAPFTIGASELTMTASIGIASGERACAEDLLRDADIAMHQAKWGGRDRFVMFESGMQDLIQTRMELEMALRGALEREEFFLVYQPTFSLRGMHPTGVEALLRWRRPDRGTVQPNDFIPLLEETGLIVSVGKWVLEEAARQGAAWRAAGHPIGVAVNVSGRQLDHDQFVTDVEEALTKSGLAPHALTLEITETTLMRNTEETATRLRAVKELGVRIAIDDFGTGYSSLAHIQRFPVDSLKIDRSFISQLADNPEGETLIRTLVQLGKALSIETLAEGIEREHELSLLQAEQCDSGQGYLYARPLEAHAAEEFLNNWQADSAAAAPTGVRVA